MIRTEIWKPTPDDKTMLKYKGQGKMKKIHSEINYALDRILMNSDGDTAFQNLYWSKPSHPALVDWPKDTTPAVTVRRGNESELIEILALRRRSAEAETMFTLKFEGFSRDEIWKIAQELDVHFD